MIRRPRLLQDEVPSSLALPSSETDLVEPPPQHPRLCWSRVWLSLNTVFAKLIALECKEVHLFQSQHQIRAVMHGPAWVSQGWAERGREVLSLRQQDSGLEDRK